MYKEGSPVTSPEDIDRELTAAEQELQNVTSQTDYPYPDEANRLRARVQELNKLKREMTLM